MKGALRAALVVVWCSLVLGCGSGGGEAAYWDVSAEMAMPGRITAIVVNAAGNTAYVTCVRRFDAELVVVDVPSQRVRETYTLPTRRLQADMLDEERGLLVLRGSTVDVHEVATGVRRSVLVGASERVVLANGFLYAADQGEPYVRYTSLDGSISGEILANPTGYGARLSTRLPSETAVLVYAPTLDADGTIRVIDTTSQAVIRSFPTAGQPMELLALSDTRVLEMDRGYLTIYDLATLSTESMTMEPPDHALGEIERTPDGSRLVTLRDVAGELRFWPEEGFLAPESHAEIAVIELETMTVSRQQVFDDVDAVPLGRFSLGVTPDLTTILLGREDTLVFLTPTEPL